MIFAGEVTVYTDFFQQFLRGKASCFVTIMVVDEKYAFFHAAPEVFLVRLRSGELCKSIICSSRPYIV